MFLFYDCRFLETYVDTLEPGLLILLILNSLVADDGGNAEEGEYSNLSWYHSMNPCFISFISRFLNSSSAFRRWISSFADLKFLSNPPPPSTVP